MSKPSTLPVWATTAGTTVAPSGGQQAAGFAVGTKPPARWVNWLFNWICQWLAYLSGGSFTPGITATAVAEPAMTLVGMQSGTIIATERPGTQPAPTGASLVGDRTTDTAGRIKTCRVAATPGTYQNIGALGSHIIKTSGNYTPTAGVAAVFAVLHGGGGAGGGANSGSANYCSAGGGGASGGLATALIVNPTGTYTCIYGAAGTVHSGAAGGPGGDTTLAANAMTYIAKGGGGGGYRAGITGPAPTYGGQPQAAGAGDTAGGGQAGGIGFQFAAGSNADGYSGAGGSDTNGVGGQGIIDTGSSANGNNASGYASGGGGAISYGTDGAKTGGAATAGYIEFYEFF